MILMATYQIAGSYFHLEPEHLKKTPEEIAELVQEVELEGHLKVDEGLLEASRTCPVTGRLAAKIPRTVSPSITGFIAAFEKLVVIDVVQRPENEEYSPCIYGFRKYTGGIAGSYNGKWTFLAPELVDQLPEQPSIYDLKFVFEETKRLHGQYIQPATLTLSLGKPFRVWRRVTEEVGKLAERMSPKPQPAPEPGRGHL